MDIQASRIGVRQDNNEWRWESQKKTKEINKEVSAILIFSIIVLRNYDHYGYPIDLTQHSHQRPRSFFKFPSTNYLVSSSHSSPKPSINCMRYQCITFSSIFSPSASLLSLWVSSQSVPYKEETTQTKGHVIAVQQSRFRVVGERVERWRTMFHDKNPYKRTSSNYIQVQFNLAWEITTTVIGHRSATERRYVMQDRQRPNVQHLWDHVLVCTPTGQNKVAHRTAWSRNREEINRRLDLMLTLNYKLGIIKSWKKERLVPNIQWMYNFILMSQSFRFNRSSRSG